MGVHGRDYMRDRSVFDDGGFDGADGGRPRRPWATWAVVGLMAVLWMVFSASSSGHRGASNELGRFIEHDLLLHPLRSLTDGPLWQMFTCLGFHSPSGITHVGWDLVLLFFLGRAVERSRGSAFFLGLASVGGLAGSVIVVVLAHLGFAVPAYVLGSSGIVMALAPAATRALGSSVVMLAGRPIRKAVVVWSAVLATILIHPGVVTGEGFLPSMIVAHLASGLAGFWMARRPKGKVVPGPASPTPSSRGGPEDPVATDDLGPSVRERVDVLLERIAAEGLASLTDDERAFLEKASERFP